VQQKHREPTQNPSVLNPAIPVELDSPILSLLNRNPKGRLSPASAAVSGMESAWLAAQQRLWRRRELPQRYLLALAVAAIAILIAGWLASWRVVRILEARSGDARFALVPKHAPDPRLLVVTLDDEAIAGDPRPLAEWDGKFTDLMERILGGGARAIALDFLLPPSWGESQNFARVIETHPDRIALAIFSQSGKVVGTECISALTAQILGPERYSGLFGFANLAEDEDRRIRRERLFFSDRDGNLRPTLASRATRAGSLWPSALQADNREVRIDYSIPPKAIAAVSWNAASAKPPDFFADKLVILGADYAGGSDRHRVPATADPDWVSGSVIQAMIANTIAENLPVGEVSLLACLAGMSLACFATLVLALQFPHRPSWAMFFAAGACCGYALLAFGMFRASRTMLVLVAPEIALLLSIVIAFYLRSRLAPYPVKGV
jgi:CHASE2 domain-containing sensor protein